MAIFDVSSLSISIPLDESIALCVQLLFDNHETILHNDWIFDRVSFRKLLSFAVKDSHFMLNGKLFDQPDGVAMGSPCGPSLANISKCGFEDKYVNNCPSRFKPILYCRYVDDTFCLFKSRNDVDIFLNHIDTYPKNPETNQFLLKMNSKHSLVLHACDLMKWKVCAHLYS